MQLTIELIEDLDARRDADASAVMVRFGADYDGPSPLFLDLDYDLSQLPELAERWGVSLETLSKYRLLVDYIDQTAQYCLDEECSPSPEVMATELGISFEEFEPYFLDKVNAIRNALADKVDEEAVSNGEGALPWDTDEDLELDLQQDALLQGD